MPPRAKIMMMTKMKFSLWTYSRSSATRMSSITINNPIPVSNHQSLKHVVAHSFSHPNVSPLLCGSFVHITIILLDSLLCGECAPSLRLPASPGALVGCLCQPHNWRRGLISIISSKRYILIASIRFVFVLLQTSCSPFLLFSTSIASKWLFLQFFGSRSLNSIFRLHHTRCCRRG